MSGRDCRGRFTGATPGPGRPPKARERAYLDATVACCSLEQWRQIVGRAVADAIAGDAVARRWLSDVLIGKDPVVVRDLVDEVRAVLEELDDGG